MPVGSDRSSLLRLCGALLELGVALDGDQYGAHLVSLREHDLLEIAVLKCGAQAVQFPHSSIRGRGDTGGHESCGGA